MNQYPGTNYHDLNLNWLLQQMKACLAEWAETKEDWQELETDNTEFKTYVTNYLQNLDISEEVSANFAAFVASGEFLALITDDPTGDGSALSDAVSAWMNTHITQEEGYVLDDTLTEPTMAAQAKAAGDRILDLKNQIPHATDGEETLPGTWGIGAIYQNTGLPRTDVKYRIMTPDIVTVDAKRAGTYYVHPGYKLYYWKFINGSLSGSMVINNGFITLEAGDTCRMEIRAIPEDTSVVLTGVSTLLYAVTRKAIVSYKSIKEDAQNYANGNYEANGGTLNGDTVTVTAAYQGIASNDFLPKSNKIAVTVKSTFNVPRLIFRLQYFTTSWQTQSIQDLTNNTEITAIIDISNYQGSKYRILLQNASIASGETNTIKVDKLIINDYPTAKNYSYYDADFETMLAKTFAGIDRSRIYTCLKDTDPNAPGDFNNFVTAVQTLAEMDGANLFVGAGEWDIISELGTTYMAAVDAHNNWGLVLKNKIRIVGSSKAVIKAIHNMSDSTYAEEQHNNIKQYFSVFNAGVHGFTIENLSIEDENIRYSVHDDLGNAGSTPYHNRYLNCRFKHIDGMYPDCIGAGIGEDCYVEIRGCFFDGDVTRNGNPVTRYVYYHGNNNSSVTDAKAQIYVTDNYFTNSGTFKLTNYGTSEAPSGIAYVSNNCMGSEPEVTNGSSVPVPNNMVMYKWNNVVRT